MEAQEFLPAAYIYNFMSIQQDDYHNRLMKLLLSSLDMQIYKQIARRNGFYTTVVELNDIPIAGQSLDARMRPVLDLYKSFILSRGKI